MIFTNLIVTVANSYILTLLKKLMLCSRGLNRLVLVIEIKQCVLKPLSVFNFCVSSLRGRVTRICPYS